MLLTELFELYAKKRLRARSPHTTRLYKHSIKAFGQTLSKLEPTTDDLTDENLEDHMWRIVESGLSVATANKDRAQILAMWHFAHRNKIVDTWPNVTPMPEPERVPLGWMPDELDALFASIARREGEVAGAPASLWWRALINVLLDTGERIGAVKQLKRSNLQESHILVPAEHRKGKTRDKLFALSEVTVADVRLLLQHHNYDLIFPWDRCETHIYHHYKRILQKAGLPDSAKHKFHALRRTVASAVTCEGGDATEALDHANPRTTKKYIDPRIVKQVPTADLVAQWRRKNRKPK